MRRLLAMILLLGAAPVPADTLRIGGVAFPQSDFLDARAVFDETGAPVIYATMSPTGRKKLSKVTRANLGKQLVVRLNARLLMKPVIRAPLLDGTLQIGGLASVDEARQLAKLMSGKEPLPESLDE